MTVSNSLEELLSLLSITQYRLRDEELGCLCLNPEHDDKNIGNFYINLRTGLFNCFACGFSGNILYLLNQNGVSYTKSVIIWNRIQLDKNLEFILPNKPINEYELLSYLNNPLSTYALERVGDENVIKEYDVREDNSGNPIFFTKTTDNRFTSVWTREVGENGGYLLLQPLNAKASGVFFGEHLIPTHYHVLCEGPFDAMAVRKYTGQKAICGFGTQLSKVQINRLRNMWNLVVFFDGDKAGRLARDKLVRQLSGKSDLFVAGGYWCDPDELGEKIISVFDNIKYSPEYRLNYARNRVRKPVARPK